MSETQTAPSPAHPPVTESTLAQSTESTPARCEVCGNHYHRTFEVLLGGVHHVFDSFECAIEKLAPRCADCGCRVIGHGVERRDVIYCCEHCCRKAGSERHDS